MPIITTEPPSEQITGFRRDLRTPKVNFGRCGITGEWGKVIAVDLGDMVVQAPGYYRDGVWHEPELVTYTNTVTLSKDGLRLLGDALDGSDNPIPAYVPDLKYQWEVAYMDGSAERQFFYSEDGEEEERAFPLGRAAEIKQVSLIDRIGLPNGLPTFTANITEGRFFRNGEEISTGYTGELHPGRTALSVRKSSILFGSQMEGTGERNIGMLHASILYVIGWKNGDWGNTNGSCNLIAVDERGAWRPYDQITPEQEAHAEKLTKVALGA